MEMETEVKVEVPEEDNFPLKLESDAIPKMEDNELTTGDDYQFGADSDLAQYQGEGDQTGNEAADIIDKFVIESGSQVFDSNTYVTAIDDGEQGEQFLTIPRGRTQITVCDNGNIVYSDGGPLENIDEPIESKSNAMDSVEGEETLYYQPQEDDNATEEMETETFGDSSPYIQQVIDTEGLDAAGFAEASQQDYSTETFIHEDQVEDYQAQVVENDFNTSEYKKVISIQETQRGIKRTMPSPLNKNVVAKVFVQGNPPTSQNQPIKIIASVQGTMVGGRSMSLAQAQRLGLISHNTKFQQVVQGGGISSPGRMIVKKVIPTSSSGASVLAIKSPTKILPAPPPNKTRIPALAVRGSVAQGNLMPVRTNIPVSQLKTLTAISTSTTQVRPLTVTKNLTAVGLSKIDGKTPPKVYVRPGTTVLSHLTGGITRISPGSSFQPIQIGGNKQVQYLKFVGPGSSAGSGGITAFKPKVVKAVSSRAIPVLPKPVSAATVVGKTILLPVSSDVGGLQVKSPSLSPVKGKTIATVRSGLQITDGIVGDDQIVILPADDLKDKSENQDEIEELCDKENMSVDGRRSESPSCLLEANGIRPKKPCNCTKSQCLKLYCECFANGEFCFRCNCNNCYNNIEHEEERQLSIRSCLERNPSAFRPKFQIGESEEEDRRHNKGCNCRRSGCFKNYCECFEAKLPCSKACKCQGCKNTEEEMEANRARESADEAADDEEGAKAPRFMSPSLAEALCQCILAQAEAAERNGDDVETTERRIIEEFGQCLVQIIGNRNKRDSR